MPLVNPKFLPLIRNSMGISLVAFAPSNDEEGPLCLSEKARGAKENPEEGPLAPGHGALGTCTGKTGANICGV